MGLWEGHVAGHTWAKKVCSENSRGGAARPGKARPAAGPQQPVSSMCSAAGRAFFRGHQLSEWWRGHRTQQLSGTLPVRTNIRLGSGYVTKESPAASTAQTSHAGAPWRGCASWEPPARLQGPDSQVGSCPATQGTCMLSGWARRREHRDGAGGSVVSPGGLTPPLGQKGAIRALGSSC